MNRDFKQMAPLERQADMLASKGRFGDTMLVHMNPTEVDVLRQMTPGGQLTINPDTGQPEAFLPLLLGLGGALAGGAATTGLLASLGAVGAGAIGSGLGTAIETGSLKEGLKAGLISGLIGNVAGKFFDTAGAAAGAGGKAGEQVVQQSIPEVTSQTAGQTGTFFGVPAPSAVAAAPGAPAATGSLFGVPVATTQVTSTAAPQVVQEVAKESPSLITNLLTNPKVQESAMAGAATGITGQALTDQFNLLNQPMGPGLDEDEEEFYVPVTPRDRGVQFPGSGFSGSGEFDFFSNPFGFDPTPPGGLQEGGMVQGATRSFQRGGGVAPRRSDYGGSTRQQQLFDRDVREFEEIYGPIESQIGNPNANRFAPSPNIPSYFTQGVNSVGDNLDDMITEQITERVYTPRAEQMPSTSVSNIRGAGAVDFVDYNRRLLGDPTRTREITRPMTEEEISARDAELAVMQAEEAANAPAAFQPNVQFDPLQFMQNINIGGRSGEIFTPEFRGDFNPFVPSIGSESAPPSFDPTMPAMDFAAPVALAPTPDPIQQIPEAIFTEQSGQIPLAAPMALPPVSFTPPSSPPVSLTSPSTFGSFGSVGTVVTPQGITNNRVASIPPPVSIAPPTPAITPPPPVSIAPPVLLQKPAEINRQTSLLENRRGTGLGGIGFGNMRIGM